MAPEQELRAWLALLRAEHFGAVSVVRLVERYGSAAAALDAGARSWRAEGFRPEQCASLAAPDEAGIAADLKWLHADPRRHIIPYSDPRYPPRLPRKANGPKALLCASGPWALRTCSCGSYGTIHEDTARRAEACRPGGAPRRAVR